MIRPRQKPRPSPIHIPKLVGKQERENFAHTVDRTYSPPQTPPPATSHAQNGLPTNTLPAIRTPSDQGTLLTRSSIRLATTVRTSTLLQTTLPIPQPLITPNTTKVGSPTVTTIITVTSSFNTPEAGHKTPEADEIVFISQRVTVTVAPQITLPSNNKGGPPIEILSAGATIPLIVLGVIGTIAAVVVVAIVIWRRTLKKRKSDLDNLEKTMKT